MYDITNYDSFADLEDWYRLVQATFATHDMPYVALVGNKSTLLGVYVLPRACCLTRNVFAADLLHMKAVKTSKHNQFAEENDFYSYVMSAKTGDQVNACFTRIAADLAGVVLSRAELDVQTKPVTAELINHQQNDPTVKEEAATETSKKRCCIQ